MASRLVGVGRCVSLADEVEMRRIEKTIHDHRWRGRKVLGRGGQRGAEQIHQNLLVALVDPATDKFLVRPSPVLGPEPELLRLDPKIEPRLGARRFAEKQHVVAHGLPHELLLVRGDPTKMIEAFLLGQSVALPELLGGFGEPLGFALNAPPDEQEPFVTRAHVHRHLESNARFLRGGLALHHSPSQVTSRSDRRRHPKTGVATSMPEPSNTIPPDPLVVILSTISNSSYSSGSITSPNARSAFAERARRDGRNIREE